MATSGKDVIYVDVDDEITGIIDKVTSSNDRIVALVLPKRATVFQSIVNMKLLKHSADSSRKQLVLITSEIGLLPLAGSVGLPVAKTLQTKPEIPVIATNAELPDDINEEETMVLPAEDFDPEKAGAKTVGDLAKAAGVSQMAEDTIELDNTDLKSSGLNDSADVAAMAAGGGAGKSGKTKKDKSLRIPNFEKFRLKLIIGALLIVLLIVGWIISNNTFAKATITIKTDNSTISSNLTPTLDTTASSVSTVTQTVPAKVEQLQKTYTQQASASGKQNNGSRASGTVTLSLTDCAKDSVTVPAGTGVSSSGLTFITQTTVTLSSVKAGNKCANPACVNSICSYADVPVISQSGGTEYNIGPTKGFTVAGLSDVTGSSSASMTGGTDNIVTVIQQADIDGAKSKLEAAIDKPAVQTQLQKTLQSDGKFPIVTTLNASAPNTTNSANIGDQVASVTVTEVITYTMFGVNKSDLVQLVSNNVNQQIDTSKQSIQSDGIDSAVISVPNPPSATKVGIAMQVASVVGSHLDANKLKSEIIGKKSGDIQGIITGNPGVVSVSVKFSPFWVNSVPKNTNKIIIIFDKPSSK